MLLSAICLLAIPLRVAAGRMRGCARRNLKDKKFSGGVGRAQDDGLIFDRSGPSRFRRKRKAVQKIGGRGARQL